MASIKKLPYRNTVEIHVPHAWPCFETTELDKTWSQVVASALTIPGSQAEQIMAAVNLAATVATQPTSDELLQISELENIREVQQRLFEILSRSTAAPKRERPQGSKRQVQTPFGPGTMVSQRNSDLMITVQLAWGKAVIKPENIRITEQHDAEPQPPSSATAAEPSMSQVDSSAADKRSINLVRISPSPSCPSSADAATERDRRIENCSRAPASRYLDAGRSRR